MVAMSLFNAPSTACQFSSACIIASLLGRLDADNLSTDNQHEIVCLNMIMRVCLFFHYPSIVN